ncbi:MAG: STN domain-containing protein, partial [Alcaligenes sp.]
MRATLTAGRKAVLTATCAGAFAVGMPAVWAQSAPAAAPVSVNAQRSYQIPAGALADALTQFARTAGVVLSFDPALVRGRHSDGLNGTYSVGAGFARILSGSGLQARAQSGNTWTLAPAPASGDAHVLAPVTVSGMSESALAPTVGYVASASVSA